MGVVFHCLHLEYFHFQTLEPLLVIFKFEESCRENLQRLQKKTFIKLQLWSVTQTINWIGFLLIHTSIIVNSFLNVSFHEPTACVSHFL